MSESSLAVHFSSASAEWGTDPDTFAELDARYGKFVIDACANAKNAKCSRYYSKENSLFDNVLDDVWFMNPVYGDPENPCATNCKKLRCLTCAEVHDRTGVYCKPGCQKHRGRHINIYVPGIIDFMRYAREAGKRVPGCCIIPARTDAGWFRETVLAPFGHPVRQWQDFERGLFGTHWSEGLIVELELRPGRETFVPGDGRKVFSAPFPSATVHYRPAQKRK